MEVIAAGDIELDSESVRILESANSQAGRRRAHAQEAPVFFETSKLAVKANSSTVRITAELTIHVAPSNSDKCVIDLVSISIKA